MTVRAEVARREGAQTPGQAIKHQLDLYGPIVEKLLPRHISRERFGALIGNACRTTPELLSCDLGTVVAAALRAAQLGLEPNDVRNQCWILPYGGKAQFQLGYGGVLELARRAAPGLKAQGHPVYPNDDFDLDYGRTQPLIHKPHLVNRLPRGGDAFAWYVLLRYPDGGEFVHVLDREGVEYHRRFSKQPNGSLWSKSYDAGALKSVVMDMRRWLPQSTEFANAVVTDESVATLRDLEVEADEGLAIPPAPVPSEPEEMADA